MSSLTTGEGTRPRLLFHLPLDPARLRRARHRVRDYLEEHVLDPVAVHDVILSIEEAMSNGVRHSGAGDGLEVELGFEGTDLITEVRDHGCGFDVECFDPQRLPDPLSSTGRGLYLIAHLMDELELRSEGGLTVRAVRRDALTGAEGGIPGLGGAAVPGAEIHRDARQQAMLEEIREAFFALDWEYRYTYVNEAAERMWSKSRERHLGRTVWEVYPLTPPRVVEALRDSMELGRPAFVEVQSVKRGTWREYRAYPTSFGVVAYVRDIDERKRKELERDGLLEALRESEQQFSSLFDSMLEGVVLHELVYVDGRAVDYRILEINPAFELQTGFSREQARGSLASELYGTGEVPYLADFTRVTESGQPRSFETYFAPLGRHFQITAVSPAPGRFATIFEDVTDRMLAEEELRRTREDLDRAQAIGQIGSWRLDVRRNVLAWSDECYRIFGLTKGTPLTYETFLSFVHPDDRAFVDAQWQASLSSEPYDIEHRIVVDGEVKWVREKALLEHSETGELCDGFGTTQDITERKRADEELRALYEDQQRIATTLQENLVHPLPTITGLELASLSLPAHRAELLGGDFHDVFRVADDRVVVLVGDVMGKGVKAAGLTETVHSAVRALALVTASPAKILRHVNRLLLAEEQEQFVSALVLLLDPTTGRCRLASAGHPPPIVVSAGGAHLVEPRYGPPLGTFESLYTARECELPIEETLVLYTDGLTEARRGGELFGERRLLDAAREAPDRTPQALIEHLREAVLAYAGTLGDDLEILALRRTGRSS